MRLKFCVWCRGLITESNCSTVIVWCCCWCCWCGIGGNLFSSVSFHSPVRMWWIRPNRCNCAVSDSVRQCSSRSRNCVVVRFNPFASIRKKRKPSMEHFCCPMWSAAAFLCSIGRSLSSPVSQLPVLVWQSHKSRRGVGNVAPGLVIHLRSASSSLCGQHPHPSAAAAAVRWCQFLLELVFMWYWSVCDQLFLLFVSSDHDWLCVACVHLCLHQLHLQSISRLHLLIFGCWSMTDCQMEFAGHVHGYDHMMWLNVEVGSVTVTSCGGVKMIMVD